MADVESALHNLIGSERTGDARADLIAAVREAMRRRERNTIDGGACIAALVESGVTYRQIEQETGIPLGTLHRWATPPREADQTGEGG